MLRKTEEQADAHKRGSLWAAALQPDSRVPELTEAPAIDPRCTMYLGILFSVLAYLLSDAVPVKRQAYFNSTAYLPCPFTKAQNISPSELVVFWQDRKNSVLYEHYLGAEKLDNVNAKYLSRTSFDRDNHALRLHNVQIKDTGLYDCFIQQKTPTGSIILQQWETELSVIANFSEPEIEEAQNETRNTGINLTCSSKQGYPEPTKMYFLITNSTNEYGDNMQISQDNVTKLFSVSVSLSLPFPDGVYNMTIVCILETESMNISSKPHNMVFSQPRFDQKTWILTAVPSSVLCCLFLVYIVVKKCLKKQNLPCRPSRKTRESERDSGADESINLEEVEPQLHQQNQMQSEDGERLRKELKSASLK